MEFPDGPDPLLAAAIIAALTHLLESEGAATARPAASPLRGRWMASALPRSVPPPHIARPAPSPRTWSLGADRDEPLSE